MTTSKSYAKGTRVRWNWGSGTAEGSIEETFTDDVERQIKDTEVKRNASEDCPAYLIVQDDGDRVLKSHSELEKV